MMHWVLQGNIFNEFAWEEFISTLRRFELPYTEHKIIPFLGKLMDPAWEGEGEPPEDPRIQDLSNAIVMGSYSMRHTAKQKGWYPGSFDLYEKGNFENCMKHWSDHMLNADSVVVPFKDARWMSGEEMFIRPTDDSKHFAGKIMEADEFADWQRNVCVLNLDYGNSLTSDTLIQVTRPKKIHAEYRCWVINGKIVTISRYKLGQHVLYHNFDNSNGDEVRAYAQKMVDIWQPHDAFVIDVCETPEGMKIVEVNTLNSCGFYACDMQKLVMGLHDAFSK
jgi:hypothetical protein